MKPKEYNFILSFGENRVRFEWGETTSEATVTVNPSQDGLSVLVTIGNFKVVPSDVR